MARTNHRMVTDYKDDLRLFGTPWKRFGLVVMIAAFVLIPFKPDTIEFLFLPETANVTLDAFLDLHILALAGVFAIGAIGLNLLTGYTGQISLGHGVFVGAGAYLSAYLGTEYDLALQVLLPAAAILGFVIGGLVGPFALRLRGSYLVVVTLGLVVVGTWIFKEWRSVTGGHNGRSAGDVEPAIGPINFEELSLFGREFTSGQGMFWLIWAVVGLSALLVKNIVRSRTGRALQAVRDRDLAAEVIGVDPSRYKTLAFAISSSLAAVAGALYAPLQDFLTPGGLTEAGGFGLLMSIQFVAIIILGGLGTIYGSVVGAVLIGTLPEVVNAVTRRTDLPGIAGDGFSSGLLTVDQLNQVLFGLAIAVVLLIEPRGLAAVWEKFKLYLRTWPFTR